MTLKIDEEMGEILRKLKLEKHRENMRKYEYDRRHNSKTREAYLKYCREYYHTCLKDKRKK